MSVSATRLSWRLRSSIAGFGRMVWPAVALGRLLPLRQVACAPGACPAWRAEGVNIRMACSHDIALFCLPTIRTAWNGLKPKAILQVAPAFCSGLRANCVIYMSLLRHHTCGWHRFIERDELGAGRDRLAAWPRPCFSSSRNKGSVSAQTFAS